MNNINRTLGNRGLIGALSNGMINWRSRFGPVRLKSLGVVATTLAEGVFLVGALLAASVSPAAADITPESGQVLSDPPPVVRRYTQVDLRYDSDNNGLGGAADMLGAKVGVVQYVQHSDGLLRLTVIVTFGAPLTTYRIFLVCGPSHDLACGFVDLGPLTTDAAGMGQAAVDNVGAPFGTGYRNDHVDLLQGEGDLSKGILAAGAINYFQPPIEAAAAAAAASVAGAVKPGDPSAAPQ
jgi:hypothetical protein